jgi:hypothetical protein
VAKTFTDSCHGESRDLRVFRELLTTTAKETVSVSIDVHVEPAETRIICTIDGGEPILGIGRIAVPAVRILPGQKVAINCRLDRKQEWSRWRMRIHPADNIQVVPNVERREKLEALKKSWGESDPGRNKRGMQMRQLFLNRDKSADPEFAHSLNRINDGIDNFEEMTAAAAAIRSSYKAMLVNDTKSMKFFADEQSQHWKVRLDFTLFSRSSYFSPDVNRIAPLRKGRIQS